MTAQSQQGTSPCQSCPIHNTAALQKLGVDVSDMDYVVALAGNPNTGKSTVFNALTGLRQHTGNWPGKTVTRAEGGFLYEHQRYKLVDLPGTYSLLSTSADEEVARNFLLFARPDVTIIVVDATRLERNLNLALQILEITDRAVICLNLMDEARRHSLEIDHRHLARDLGVPVVPTSIRIGEGLPELLHTIAGVANGRIICRPQRLHSQTPQIRQAVQSLTRQLQNLYPHLPNTRWLALRLLDHDQDIMDALRTGRLGELGRQERDFRLEIGQLQPAG